MKDSERLDLLKEIGGTKVYEERRRESLKIMQENEIRKNQIQEVVEQLDEKLGELDAEREELHKYQQLDKQKRGLEYAVYDKELSDARKKLDEIEQQRAKVSKSAGQRQDEVEAAAERIQQTQEELQALKAALKEGSARLKAHKESKQELLEQKTQLEMDMKDLQEKMEAEGTVTSSAEQELQQLQHEIDSKQGELAQVEQALAESEKQEHALEHELGECTRRQQLLFGKQGQNFQSKAEKDAWVMSKIQQAQNIIKKEAPVTKNYEAKIRQIEQQLQELRQEMEELHLQEAAKLAELQESDSSLAECKKKAGNLNNRRKELWKTESEIESKCATLRDELSKKERQLYNTLNNDTNNGLKSTKRIVDDNKIGGVHGPLIELIQCDPKLHTAVEIAAGNRLFNYVVDNEEIAAEILQRMKRSGGRSGRVTLMPLANLHTQEVRYPTEFGSDCVPMMKKLKFNPAITPAVMQIFGKVMICKDLDVASQVSRSTNFDSITLDGDRVDTRGPITGGYHDERLSRMDAIKGLNEIAALLEKSKGEQQGVRAELQDVDQEITRCLSKVKELEASRGNLKTEADRLKGEGRDKSRFVAAQQGELDIARKSLQSSERRVAEQESKIAAMQVELGNEFLSQLTAEEQADLGSLGQRIPGLKEQLTQAQGTKLQAQLAKEELESLLSGNLKRRQQELMDYTDSHDVQADQAALSRLQGEVAEAAAALQDAADAEKAMKSTIDDQKRQAQELKKAMETAVAEKQAEEEQAADQERILDTLLSKRTQYTQRRDDISKRIRELGSLPTEAFEKYRSKSTKELHRMLKQVAEELKQFSHVNKKALDQYVTFTEQREDLLKRQKELQSGEVKIKELVQSLDMRKDEAIERTFKQVAKNFREIFSELAPGGRGELVMQKRLPGDAVEDVEDDDGVTETHEKYSGVKVKVSFGMGEVQTMQQLSGGQKTMVALTLIFAIQRCDPAPFYLFDEIDAALDSQYRTTVAKMLEKQMEDVRNPAQFIVTTFHPQVVNVSEKIYGVSHSNRISRVDVITKEDAMTFLASEEVQRDAHNLAQQTEMAMDVDAGAVE